MRVLISIKSAIAKKFGCYKAAGNVLGWRRGVEHRGLFSAVNISLAGVFDVREDALAYLTDNGWVS